MIKKVYTLAKQLPKSEDYNLKQQLKRAIISVSLNIAEGKNRSTSKDFANFLSISVASLSEVEAILDICIELNYLTSDKKINQDINLLAKKINVFRSKLLRK